MREDVDLPSVSVAIPFNPGGWSGLPFGDVLKEFEHA